MGVAVEPNTWRLMVRRTKRTTKPILVYIHGSEAGDKNYEASKYTHVTRGGCGQFFSSTCSIWYFGGILWVSPRG